MSDSYETDAALVAELQPVIKRLNKDLREAATHLPTQEARLLVGAYYQAQEERLRNEARIRTMLQGEPNAVVKFYYEQCKTLEEYTKIALDVYSSNHPIGVWLRSIKGIGPVLASAHLAYIDVTKAPYAGHIWSYAGLTPNGVHRKGVKTTFDPRYKTICWLTGESFVKVSGREDAFYGQLYKKFRKYEDDKNEQGAYKELAAQCLAERKYGDETESKKAYVQGKLPKAHLYARAKRRTVKVFLSHLHYKLYVEAYGKEPPMPYAVDYLGHCGYIAPPV